MVIPIDLSPLVPVSSDMTRVCAFSFVGSGGDGRVLFSSAAVPTTILAIVVMLVMDILRRRFFSEWPKAPCNAIPREMTGLL